MTQRQYIINRKLNILELGRTLGNISEAQKERVRVTPVESGIIDHGFDKKWIRRTSGFSNAKQIQEEIERIQEEIDQIDCEILHPQVVK